MSLGSPSSGAEEFDSAETPFDHYIGVLFATNSPAKSSAEVIKGRIHEIADGFRKRCDVDSDPELVKLLMEAAAAGYKLGLSGYRNFYIRLIGPDGQLVNDNGPLQAGNEEYAVRDMGSVTVSGVMSELGKEDKIQDNQGVEINYGWSDSLKDLIRNALGIKVFPTQSE